jgi:hypothetical protein
VTIEALTYRLNARGRPAGRMLLQSGVRRQVALAEARLQLQGSLGSVTVVQTSRSDAREHHSLQWREALEGRQDQPPFEVHFDAEQGVVRATRGRHDQASVPYLLPYRDPLSLLRELRERTAHDVQHDRPPAATPWRIPLLGKDVLITAIRDGVMENRDEERPVRSYTLHPGGSVVVVERRAPYPILRFLQRLPDTTLEATLVELGSAKSMTGWDDEEAVSESKPGGNRRRGRRRRRVRVRG